MLGTQKRRCSKKSACGAARKPAVRKSPAKKSCCEENSKKKLRQQ